MGTKYTTTQVVNRYQTTQVPETLAVASVPFPSDLGMHLKTRTELDLFDATGSNNAEIFLPEFLNDSALAQLNILGDSTNQVENLWDGGNHTLYFRAKQEEDITSTRRMLFSRTTGRGLDIYNYYNYIRVAMEDTNGTLIQFYASSDRATQINPLEWYDFILTIDGTAKEATSYIYDPDGNLVHSHVEDISTFVFDAGTNQYQLQFGGNYGHTTVTNFKKFGEVKTLLNCLDHSYSTDLEIHLPTLMQCADISGQGNHFYRESGITDDHKVYRKMSSLPLDYGLDWYKEQAGSAMDMYQVYNSNLAALYVDKSASTPPNDYPFAGYQKVSERARSTTGVNHPDCKIRFTNTYFDRSNTTIWGADARGGYYDASNPRDWHILELNQRTIQAWANDGYKGRAFVKYSDNSIEEFDRKILEEVILYDTNKTGADHLEILEYTGDDFAVVYSGGSPLYDANNQVQLGYLKTTKGMFTVRFDDTRNTTDTNYLPIFQAQGELAFTGCHIAQLGQTVGSVTFATLEELQILDAAGWEIASHNREDDDYNYLEFANDLEDLLRQSKTEQEAYGIACEYYIGNKYSYSNLTIPYLVHKIGWKAGFAWAGTGGLFHEACPQAIDKYRLTAMAGDLQVPDGTYNLESVPNTTQIANIKAQIDICKAQNRWAILMLHDYTAAKGAALNEIIDYCQSEGVDIVTPTQALANTEYQL